MWNSHIKESIIKENRSKVAKLKRSEIIELEIAEHRVRKATRENRLANKEDVDVIHRLGFLEFKDEDPSNPIMGQSSRSRMMRLLERSVV